jgi:hypothetical protein
MVAVGISRLEVAGSAADVALDPLKAVPLSQSTSDTPRAPSMFMASFRAASIFIYCPLLLTIAWCAAKLAKERLVCREYAKDADY